MKDKIYLGIIVLLVFAVVISFTVEDAETAELKDKLTEVERLKKASADLEKEIYNKEGTIQNLRVELAKNAAEALKRKQYTVNYENLKTNYPRKIKGFDEYMTNEGLQHMRQSGPLQDIDLLLSESKSNLSVHDITFEMVQIESKSEISLDYNIEIVIDPVSDKGKKRTVTNSGNMWVIKTEDGWKVNKDIDRMNGIFKVMEDILSQKAGNK
ncbi:hypothetical protein [Virgibacillus doumboii]|uniref:hypothetical protein n=1 Tax=Virgibacillus doumboii TaxID=2697503 RepID=UPI0013DFA23F|nr:hypothetical protein [Virgibacillus doumboii]